jgi:hypothetical protein
VPRISTLHSLNIFKLITLAGKLYFAATIVSIAGGGTTKLKTAILENVKEAMVAMKEASGLKLDQPRG